MIREHGEIYTRKFYVSIWTCLKTMLYCEFHGETALLDRQNCDAGYGQNCKQKADEIRRLETADFERMAQAKMQPVAANMEIFWQSGL